MIQLKMHYDSYDVYYIICYGRIYYKCHRWNFIRKMSFETASAVGTVGLTLGITPQLGILSKNCSYYSYVYGQSWRSYFNISAFSGNGNSYSKFPEEKINIG